MDKAFHPDAPRLSPPFRGLAWLWAMPNIAVLLFVTAMASFMLWVKGHDADERRFTLIEDILWQEQTIRMTLTANEETLTLLARDLADEPDSPALRARAAFYPRSNPEILSLALIEAGGAVLWRVPEVGDTPHKSWSGTRSALEQARLSGQRTYGNSYRVSPGDSRFDVFFPIFRERRHVGTLVATYSVERILERLVPWWFAQKYQLEILDSDGEVLAAKLGLANKLSDVNYQVQFDPPGYGLLLRATAYTVPTGFAERGLVALVVGLSLVMVWSLWAIRKHISVRFQAEQALSEEYAFRKAMEDSILTGMRAVDMGGRVSYVNPAFCRMTGFSEAELVGCQPPMPYWPPEEMEAASAAFSAMLAGTVPPTGVEHRFMRRDGTRFDAVLYVSPLIDAAGAQTGWMASITDITERKRVREELRASHERFVAVLEALDSAVSVCDADNGELLYANGPYTRRFGLAAGDAPCCPVLPWRQEASRNGRFDTEASLPHDGRWYHAHGRRFTWVDGRAARVEVITDITELKTAEELGRVQMEKLQFTARLVTMGEMASTLAHELNQPLSAVSSYVTGCLNKLRSGRYTEDELVSALDKVARQSQRAGSIIRGIREFVKKSEPRKVPVEINQLVEETLGFVEIDARRRGAQMRFERGEGLPLVNADRTMIGQVLLNLVKNAVEAMEATPQGQRVVTVRTGLAEAGSLRVEVSDRGPGLDAQTAEQLFAPFYTTKSEGMGMGLNICRSVVEYHHGRLSAENGAEGGARFAFTLPVEA